MSQPPINEAVPSPEAVVQVAIEHLSGRVLRVVDDHVELVLPTLKTITPEQREYIQTRRDERAKHAARLSLLRQTESKSSHSEFFDPDEE